MQPVPIAADRLAARPPAIPPSHIRTDRSQPLVGIGYVAHRLNRDDASAKTIVARIRQLIRGYGFPPPYAPRLSRGVWHVGADAVEIKARWHKVLVDDWFDNLLPPELRLAVDNAEAAAEQAHVASVLDARAASIGSIK